MGAALTGACLGGVISACSFESLNPSEADAVITFEDRDRDYSTLRTYALGDRVSDLCQLKGEDEPTGPVFSMGGAGGMGATDFDSGQCVEVNHKQDDVVLETLDENMKELGYRRIDDPSSEEPDVVLFVGIMPRQDRLLGTTAWCNAFPGFNGCWVPADGQKFGLRDGSLVVEMVDVSQSEDGQFSSAWTFTAQGLLTRFNPPTESGGLTTAEEVEEAIDRAFEQSPYLVEGGDE